MRDPRKEYLQRFLDNTDKTLDELEEYQRSLYSDIDNLDDAASRQMMQRFHNASDIPGAYPVDGYFEYSIDTEKLTVYGEFYPPTEGMKPLFLDDVARILAENEIVHGLDWDAIHAAILACNTEQNPKTGVIVARGDAPQPYIPEHIVLEQRFTETPRAEVPKDASIDYRDISPFVLVKQHEQLAHIVSEQPGIPGRDVTGNEIPFINKNITSLIPGKNTETQNRIVISACDGRFETEESGFRVNEVLMVKTDIGYKTGNIDFPGDVIISGNVSDNFLVKSGGSVYSQETLDATQIECDGDLIVKKGIIGRKTGVVKAGGKVSARFLENCYVEAGGEVSIVSGIMHSSIYTNAKVLCRPRGLLIGGTVYAQDGVRAYQIGSQMAATTEIYCGIDYLAMNKLNWIKDKNIQLAYTLHKVNDQMRHAQAGTLPRLQETRQKILQTISKMNDQAASLVFSLDKNDSATVDVFGTIYPGVYIEIAHISYIVNRQMSRVRFRLNKDEGRIVTEAITAARNTTSES